MTYREPFAVNEWYHCYNRGVDKRIIFVREADYYRFLMLLWLVNDSTTRALRDIQRYSKGPTLTNTFELEHTDEMVEIGAYCLMPNHYHLLLRQKVDGGITSFMRRLATGYTMYFNLVNDRSGTLFQGTFKSKHVDSDLYLKRLTNYIHTNPIDIIGSNVPKQLLSYSYSSLPDYVGTDEIKQKRKQTKLVGPTLRRCWDTFPSLNEMLREATLFQKHHHPEV